MEKKKVIIVGASILILGIGAYFLTRPSKGKSVFGSKKKYIDESDTSTTLIFSASQKAALLYEAMNRYFGTDENLIIETLTGVTQAQFGAINKLWGLKNYNSILGYNTYGGAKQPLKLWLREELNDDYYNLLRKKFPLYL